MSAELDGLSYVEGRCNESITLWPDDEAIELYCVLDPGHDPQLEPHRADGWVWVDSIEDAYVESPGAY